jgi:hypothetical protein
VGRVSAVSGTRARGTHKDENRRAAVHERLNLVLVEGIGDGVRMLVIALGAHPRVSRPERRVSRPDRTVGATLAVQLKLNFLASDLIAAMEKP